jgi:hypothetical protein
LLVRSVVVASAGHPSAWTRSPKHRRLERVALWSRDGLLPEVDQSSIRISSTSSDGSNSAIRFSTSGV